MFIYPPTVTIYNILRTSYFTAYYEDSTSKVRGYSRIHSTWIGRLSIRSEGQCSSVVPLKMHNRRRKGLPDYDHRSCILQGPHQSKSRFQKFFLTKSLQAPLRGGEGRGGGVGGGGGVKRSEYI
jgi:hypothetical protein